MENEEMEAAIKTLKNYVQLAMRTTIKYIGNMIQSSS